MSVSSPSSLNAEVQSVTYAASIVPEPDKAECLEIGALTGNITIGATVKHVKGMKMIFKFLQDATGGRTVTWNAQYKHAWSDTGNTANKLSTIMFIYNGTNWVQVGAQSPYI